MKQVLVVAAHPDDEVLGCGATIAKLVDDGYRVNILILGEGAMSRTRAKKEDVKELEKQCCQAAQVLGAEKPFFAGYSDNCFDTVPLLNIVKAIERYMIGITPYLVFTHFAGDLNIDHQIAHRAVLTACRPKAGSSVREILTYEVPSATDWAYGEWKSFRPNVFYDVTNYWGKKQEALSCYATEILEFPHPRSLVAMEARMRVWGSFAGCGYAEAFGVVRSFRG